MNKTTTNKLIAFWLIPNQSDKIIFQNLITNLAKTTNAATFEPHITLYTTVKLRTEDYYYKFIEKITPLLNPIQLTPDQVQIGDNFTNTIFVTFKGAKTLISIFNLLHQELLNNNYTFNPHLSLLYSNIIQEQKLKLAKSIVLSEKMILFDTVKLIEVELPIRTNQDIFKWKEIYSITLKLPEPR